MSVLVLGDVHFPYQHDEAIDWAVGLAEKLRPKTIVQVGDLFDMFAFSRFPKLVKKSPDEELTEAKLLADKFWLRFRRATDHKAKCFQLMGNHDDRPMKRALEVAPELAPLVGRSMRELFTFQGVTTIYESARELELDGVFYQHGHRSKLGDHARFNQQSTVCGHSHTGGVVYQRNKNGVFWELNAGFLGAVGTEAFSYHAQRTMHTCTLGVGIIDELGPRFVPFKE